MTRRDCRACRWWSLVAWAAVSPIARADNALHANQEHRLCRSRRRRPGDGRLHAHRQRATAWASSTWPAARSIRIAARSNDHRRAQMYDIFCGKGYTVFAVRPGSITKFSLAEMAKNLKQGIALGQGARRANTRSIPTRLGITGGSAGGHLASLVAVTADDKIVGQSGRRVLSAHRLSGLSRQQDRRQLDAGAARRASSDSSIPTAATPASDSEVDREAEGRSARRCW